MTEYPNKKILKYVVIAAIAATVGVLIKEFAFPGAVSIPPMQADVFSEIKIDFTLLEGEELKALLPFDEIILPDGSAGRENPFTPY